LAGKVKPDSRGRVDLGLGPLQSRVMDVLWSRGSWITVQGAREALNQNGTRQLAYSTIKTVLCILTERGFAKKRQRGRAYEYLAHRTRADFENAAIVQFIRPLAGRMALIVKLVEEVAVSNGDFAQIERVLAEKRRQREVGL